MSADDGPPPRRDLADRHGRRARPRGGADPRRHGVRRGAEGVRAAVPGPDQQLDLHPARPARPAACQRHRRARGGHLDLGAGHRAVPGRPAAARDGVRRRRGRPDDGAARRRLRDDRPQPRLRGARRDPHLLVRVDHQGHPADRRRRPFHRDQPRRERPEPPGQAAGDRLRRGPDQHRHRPVALLHRQAQPADDAQRPEPARGPLRDHRDGRRPDGHRHHQRPRGGAAHRAGHHRLDPPGDVEKFPYRPTRVCRLDRRPRRRGTPAPHRFVSD